VSGHHLALGAVKIGAALLLVGGLSLVAYGVAGSDRPPGRAHLEAYMAQLDRTIRLCFLQTSAAKIVRTQALLLVAAVAAYIAIGTPLALIAAVLVAVLPSLALGRIRRKRTAAFNSEADGFVLALANSLKAVPSIGAALAGIVPVLRDPVRQEVNLVLGELRVGSSVDQALLDASARVQSSAFDAAISALLVGRKVGGDLPRILETTASTIREMNRLEVLVRTKTAESRAQLWVLALFPVGIIVVFSFLSPQYFEPLQQSFAGHVVMLLTVALWLAAVFIARALTKVDL
jgi:tight adherence protein B